MIFSVKGIKDVPNNIRPIKEKIIHKGGNSAVYEWKNQEGSYIVKKFSGTNKNISERFEREKTSLILLEHNGIKNVPRLLHSNFDEKIIITTKLPGIKPEKVTLEIFKEHFKMTKLLMQNSLIIPERLQIKNAADSLLDPIGLITKIKTEFNAVKKLIACQNNPYNEFYLEAEYIIDRIKKSLNQQTDEKNISSGLPKIFSFSDLGPRNMLADKSGLYFLDFEHAGWDDPIKGVIDLLICPSNYTTKDDAREIARYIKTNYKEYKATQHLLEWLPVLNIKWVIIYIKYNLKLHQKASLTIGEAQEVYLKGKRMIRHIEDAINSSKGVA